MPPDGPAARQHQLVAALNVVPDPFERLDTLASRARKQTPPPAAGRRDEYRVHGCQADLWIVPHHDPETATWSFTPASDAPVVAALAHLFCDIFSGCKAGDITSFETTALDDLGLTRTLTENRRRGAANIVAKIKSYAAAAISP